MQDELPNRNQNLQMKMIYNDSLQNIFVEFLLILQFFLLLENLFYIRIICFSYKTFLILKYYQIISDFRQKRPSEQAIFCISACISFDGLYTVKFKLSHSKTTRTVSSGSNIFNQPEWLFMIVLIASSNICKDGRSIQSSNCIDT